MFRVTVLSACVATCRDSCLQFFRVQLFVRCNQLISSITFRFLQRNTESRRISSGFIRSVVFTVALSAKQTLNYKSQKDKRMHFFDPRCQLFMFKDAKYFTRIHASEIKNKQYTPNAYVVNRRNTSTIIQYLQTSLNQQSPFPNLSEKLF